MPAFSKNLIPPHLFTCSSLLILRRLLLE